MKFAVSEFLAYLFYERVHNIAQEQFLIIVP